MGGYLSLPRKPQRLAGERFRYDEIQRRWVEVSDSDPKGDFDPDPDLEAQVSSDDPRERANMHNRTVDMLAKLSEAVLAGDEHRISVLQDFELVKQLTEAAHVAAWLGHRSILELLLNRCPSLLSLGNDRGDTPLHMAARAGQLDNVKYLLEMEAQQSQSQYLIIQNKKGNTALHEALEYNHEEVARLLVTAHPELSCVLNKKDNSPAYLAAEAGLVQLLEHMLASLGDADNIWEWRGKTPLQAAIHTRNKESLGLLLRLKPQLIRATDMEGRNPFHYAASIGYYDGLIEFLKIDTLPAFQPDCNGLCPIHMAASSGHINVIQLLLEFCPSSWAIGYGRGQTVLHVAAQNGKENVVRYILKTRLFERLINEMDGKGNTPLHLATEARHFKVVRVLTGDNRVNMSITNNDDLTALDIAERNIVIESSFRKLLTLTALRIAKAPRARNLDIFDVKHPVNNNVQQPTAEFYKDRVNTLLLVSTLVATVTFAGGFTIPGGLTSDGTAIMLSNTKFITFAICDTIALFCSIIAVVSLIWAQVGDFRLVRFITGFTLPLLGISLSMMAIAFTAGLCIVIGPLHWLAFTILIITIVFLICAIALLLPLRMPIWSDYRLCQWITYYLFYLLLSATGGGSDTDVVTGNIGDKGELKNSSSVPNDLITSAVAIPSVSVPDFSRP